MFASPIIYRQVNIKISAAQVSCISYLVSFFTSPLEIFAKMYYNIYTNKAIAERTEKTMSEEKRTEKTIVIPAMDDRQAQVRMIISEVYAALRAKGYNPVKQLVGYILSDDPTYITNYKSARSLITKIERDELLTVLVSDYLETRENKDRK